jgi:hypothetical protein
MTLGAFPTTTPKQAVAKLAKMAALIAAGTDPVSQAREVKTKARIDATTFATVVDQ